jgi:hypothetical protein
VKTRVVEIFTGTRIRVPEHIQRIDSYHTHGWQLRYGKSRMFSDHSNDGSGARAALKLAIDELRLRIARLPAPSGLRRAVGSNKSSKLPVGISGPIVRSRPGRNTRDASFGVTLPRFGMKPTTRNVYIATENTYSVEKYKRALAKAIELRRNAERTYQAAATRAKRESARATKGG